MIYTLLFIGSLTSTQSRNVCKYFLNFFQTLSYLVSVVTFALDFVTSPNDFYLKTTVEMTNKKVGADTKIKVLEVLENENITNIKQKSIIYTEHIKNFMFISSL